jgi:hypothetical protein
MIPLIAIPGYDEVVGNISFSVFIANVRVLQTNGTLSYAMMLLPAGGTPVNVTFPFNVPVHYEFGAPFFSNTTAFFGFLVLLFSLFNVLGFTLGMILCYIVSRMIESKSIDHLR